MKLWAIAVMALGLTACTFTANTPDKVTLHSDGKVTIENGHSNNGSYKHCPPGQAKKGRC
jgi:hypothetical protein